MATQTITSENLETAVRDGLVLLDLWAAWCGPCRAFAPIYEAASERHPDVLFGKDGGLRTLLVLSGVTTEETLLSDKNTIAPDYYTDCLGDLRPAAVARRPR